MTAAAILGIPSEAMPAWVSLSSALESLDDEGRTPVCATQPADWSADAKLAVRREAAEACTFCPVVEACRVFGSFESFGVWGGVDRSIRPTKEVDAA